MIRKQMNPGSVHVRIGRLQDLMEQATMTGNLVLYANLLRRLKVYASVFMDEGQVKAYDSLPGLTEDERTASQVYDDLCNREEYLLEILRDNDVFTKAQHRRGDASALDDEEEEPEVPILT